LCAFQSSSNVAEPGRENSDGTDGAEHNRDLQRTPNEGCGYRGRAEEVRAR
jgi:hypothetical protein